MRRKPLNEQRQKILQFIAQHSEQHGYPPTVREIGEAVGLKSSSTVHFHLRVLTEHGYLRRDGSLTRALRLSEEGQLLSGKPEAAPPSPVGRRAADARWLPLLGEVAAGRPIFAVEDCEDLVPLPQRFVPNGEAFMLRVNGDSMIEAGIQDGDYVIVSRTTSADEGDIVVAMVDDEATVKYLHRKNGGFELRPANAAMSPIVVDEVQLVGKVTGMLRSFR